MLSSRYLQLVDHLVKQFSCLRAVGVLKVIFYTNLNHDGLQVAANACIKGIRIKYLRDEEGKMQQ